MAASPENPRENGKPGVDRRRFVADSIRALGALGTVGAAGFLLGRGGSARAATRWQIDPSKCIACGNCATHCVLDVSAVKCFHCFAMCGYCKLCTGYFEPEPGSLDSGAENQLCPTGAIGRLFVEDPYYEYSIDEELCIGCGKCVKGCGAFGNGSLYLQIQQDVCLNCNECNIATHCPSEAIQRVRADQPYKLKSGGASG